jgi:hypothetical protein
LQSTVLAASFASVENETAPKSPTFYTAIVVHNLKIKNVQRLLIGLILVFGLYSCNLRVKILNEPVTFIDSTLSLIDTSDYDFIIDKFGISGIEKPPDYFSGLKPKLPMILGSMLGLIMNSDSSFSRITSDSCLIYFGGMIPTCERLILLCDSEYIEISDQQSFIDFFKPIETEQEAIAFAAILTNAYPKYDFDIKWNYRIFKNRINKTYAKRIDNGYEVLLFNYDLNMGGKGPHPTFSIKYFISIDGVIKEIEKKKLYEDPKEDDVFYD